MATKPQCPKCGAENSKTVIRCAKCNSEMHPATPMSIAKPTTLIVDVVFIALYVVSIILFNEMASSLKDVMADEMRASFPQPGSIYAIFVLAFFSIAIVVRVLFIVNTFVIKNKFIVYARKALMFIESLSIIHLVLALYFYYPAIEDQLPSEGYKA